MYICFSLLFFFMGAAAVKQGDFGIFTACITKNKSLRLDCHYAPCTDSPSFDCTFIIGGVTRCKASDNKCRLILSEYGPLSTVNKSMDYTCILTRRKRHEEKHITVDYNIRKGRIKDCVGTTGLLLHQVPTSLWPVVILSLWRVLVTDS